ncbi:Protein RNA-directed DNA methylation 3 [Bienertia sinuspersici]
MASKGKAIAVKDSTGKRKRKDNDNGGSNKRKNRDVLQFFEDSAAEFDGDDSDDSDDFFNIDVKSEPGKFEEFPFFPKEEELSGDELEKMLAERYRTKSGYVRYAEDDYDSKRSVDKSFLIPSVVEPTIWKVKCKKFVDLKELGNKLQIISAFAVEHIKGFVFVEAEKQSDVAEACNQLADVYFSLVTKVPTNEVGQLLVVRKRYNEVKEGTWARVKNGIYRGDLTQVVAVNNERKRATVKLIPRIDLQALTVKYRTKGSVPAARLISSRDLEEFRPLIQYRRDRDTGKMFEFLDSLMLKDGFLYKKVSFDSLSFWGVNPSEDELQKFIVPCNDESDNVEWLSQLYGEQKKV